MISAIQSALSGLNVASVKLNETATNIAQGTAQSTLSAGTSAFQGSPAISLVSTAVSDPFTLFGEEASLASDFLALKEAEILYKASASLIGALAEMESELLDIKS